MNRIGITCFLRAGLTVLAVVSGPAVGAQDATHGIGEKVALALSSAQAAQANRNHKALASALAVIDRSGAHPLVDWDGADPVPRWRTLLAATAPPMRGSPLGPGYRSGQILAGHSEAFEQVFLSGQKASIALSTPGNAPISLRVLDSDHRPVCIMSNRNRTCHWVPMFTQRYTIEVRNPGDREAEYFLVVE
ncbi:hypothetical protein [Novosphingobium malaysiense]|uniref:Uncharacterized protein n=1 Tax=Novosphingobium malaysiense TaxID=1348853 RepID=A0A0B1ZT57_9SPHN|nr:hypothetical protein [Novosphingobium malaysiense]KHK92333.1 hypothetical protein LK12_05810 [Novosphingobium malaysiense]